MINNQGIHLVQKVRQHTDSAFVLRLQRNNFQFTPGQCVNLGLPDEAVNREYSTYSGIKEPYLEFLIKAVKGGMVSTKLQQLKSGDRVTLDGAYGLFTLHQPDKLKHKYTFICTGTGIAPFHSFVKSYPKIDYQILHGIRFSQEQYDKQDYTSTRYISCLSQGKGGSFSGRVTDYLTKHKIDPHRIYYLCGNNDMINDVYDLLREADVNGRN